MRTQSAGHQDYAPPWMPPQNPLTRIEQVARDLGRLAEEIGGYAGPDARTVLLNWQRELLAALDEIQRLTSAAGEPDLNG